MSRASKITPRYFRDGGQGTRRSPTRTETSPGPPRALVKTHSWLLEGEIERRTVRSMSTRRVSGCSGFTNSPDSTELRSMQDELVRPQCPPVVLPRIETADESDPMVAPFSSQDFSAALASCGARAFPGLDGIE